MPHTTGECLSTLLNIHTVDYSVTLLNAVYREILMLWGKCLCYHVKRKRRECNCLYGISPSFMYIKVEKKMYIAFCYVTVFEFSFNEFILF